MSLLFYKYIEKRMNEIEEEKKQHKLEVLKIDKSAKEYMEEANKYDKKIKQDKIALALTSALAIITNAFVSFVFAKPEFSSTSIDSYLFRTVLRLLPILGVVGFLMSLNKDNNKKTYFEAKANMAKLKRSLTKVDKTK